MLKPPMPNAAGMTDTLEFVKNLWGGMNIPGIAVPGTGSSLSTEDLDKKIADLKAVESWLNLNIGMLRGTIQALEVQRGTLATLKAMSDSMTQAMGRSGDNPGMAAPFAQFFAQSASAPAAPPQAPAASPEAAATEPGADNPMPAAVAWWNLLQDQFHQAVSSAIPTPGAGADAGSASAPADGAAAKTPAEPKAQGGSPLDVSGGASTSASSGNPGSGQAGRAPRNKADKA